MVSKKKIPLRHFSGAARDEYDRNALKVDNGVQHSIEIWGYYILVSLVANVVKFTANPTVFGIISNPDQCSQTFYIELRDIYKRITTRFT